MPPLKTTRPEYSEDPKVSHDEEYYAELTKDECIEVKMVPGKGKGAFAATAFAKDDLVITEEALVCAQNLDELKEGIPVCGFNLRSLETPQENFDRVVGSKKKLPYHDSFPITPSVPCRSPGCSQRFSSKTAERRAWEQHHSVLCKGVMSEDQVEALESFHQDCWVQGGIDYSDTFHFGLHIVARVKASVNRGESLTAAWKPFDLLISCPWERFIFRYLMNEDKKDEDWKAEERRSKEEMLTKAVALLHRIFLVDDRFVDQAKFTRVLGSVLLNGQERTPTSPFDQYVAFLEEQKKTVEWKEYRAYSRKRYPNLQFSSRGQGIYRVSSCYNHSCDPNIQVSYSEDNDETLVVYALRDIAKGEELCISYIDETTDLMTRQQQLAEHYLFKCACTKCTEEAAQQKKP